MIEIRRPRQLHSEELGQIIDLWHIGTMPKDICEMVEVSQEIVFQVVGWTPADLPNELASLQAKLSQFRDPSTARLLSKPGLASEGAVMTPSLRETHQALQEARPISVDAVSIVQRECEEGLVMLDKCLTYEVAVEEALEYTAECLSVLDPDEFSESFSRMLNSVKQRPNQLQTLVQFLTSYLSDQSLFTLCDKIKHNQTFLSAIKKPPIAESYIKGVVQRLTSDRNKQLSAIEAALTYFLYFTQADVERLAVFTGFFDCQGSDLLTLGVLQLKLCEFISLYDKETKASLLLRHLRECITATNSGLTSALDYSSVFASSYAIVSTSITEFCETNAAAVNPIVCSGMLRDSFSIKQQSFSPIAKVNRYSPSRQVRLLGFDRLSTLKENSIVEFDNELYYVNSMMNLEFRRVDKRREYAVCSLDVPLSMRAHCSQMGCLRGADYVYLYSSLCLLTSFMRFCTKTQVFEELPTAGWGGVVVAAVEMKITGCLYFVIGDQVYEFDQWALVWRDLFVHVPVELLSSKYSICKSREYSTSFFLVSSSKSKVFTIDVALNRCDAWSPVDSPIKKSV
jgi:hypothetical protein